MAKFPQLLTSPNSRKETCWVTSRNAAAEGGFGRGFPTRGFVVLSAVSTISAPQKSGKSTVVKKRENTIGFTSQERSSDRIDRQRAPTPYALTSCLFSLGSYSTMYPATALAATVKGEARYICPGPLRPGKLRFCALITTCSGRVVTPGPALMQAPQLGSITSAPAFWKISR